MTGRNPSSPSSEPRRRHESSVQHFPRCQRAAMHRQPGRDAVDAARRVDRLSRPVRPGPSLPRPAEGETHLGQPLVADPAFGDRPHLGAPHCPRLARPASTIAELEVIPPWSRFVQRAERTSCHFLPLELQPCRGRYHGVLGDLDVLPSRARRSPRGVIRDHWLSAQAAALCDATNSRTAAARPLGGPIGRPGPPRLRRGVGRRSCSRPSRSEVGVRQPGGRPDGVPPPWRSTEPAPVTIGARRGPAPLPERAMVRHQDGGLDRPQSGRRDREWRVDPGDDAWAVTLSVHSASATHHAGRRPFRSPFTTRPATVTISCHSPRRRVGVVGRAEAPSAGEQQQDDLGDGDDGEPDAASSRRLRQTATSAPGAWTRDAPVGGADSAGRACLSAARQVD